MVIFSKIWLILISALNSLSPAFFLPQATHQLRPTARQGAKYDEVDLEFRQQLMLDRDYFVDNKVPNSYVYSLGFQLENSISGASLYKGTTNYWPKLMFSWLEENKFDWPFSVHIIGHNSVDEERFVFDLSVYDYEYFWYQLEFKWLDVNGEQQRFYCFLNTEDELETALSLLFIPVIDFNENGVNNFALTNLIFNFDFAEAIPWLLEQQLNSEYTFDDLNYAFEEMFRLFGLYLFDIDPLTWIFWDTKGVSTSKTSAYSKVMFFLKNGFYLYPSHLYLNTYAQTANKANYIWPDPKLDAYHVDKVNYQRANDMIGKFYSYQWISNEFYELWVDKTQWGDRDMNPNFQTGFWDYNFSATDNTDSANPSFNMFFLDFGIEGSVYIADFNLGLLNYQDWQDAINDGDIWEIPYFKAHWWELQKHIMNAVIWCFNNLPGLNYVGQFVGTYINALNSYLSYYQGLVNNLFGFSQGFSAVINGSLVLLFIRGLIGWL